MALKNFTQFTPQTLLSATDYVVGYRDLDEIRTDLNSLTDAISGLLIIKGFTPGGSLGSVRRISYRYTIGNNSPVNAVSGVDDFSRTLSYTPSQIEVYRNGAHLIESLDFLATNSTQVTNLSTLNVGDIVEVVALSATGVTVNQTITGSGTIIQSNYRYTVPTTLANGTTLVTGPDDFGSTLRYLSPNLSVFLNGSHLVNSYDYSATDGINITLAQTLGNGDVVDVQTLSSAGTSGIFGLSAYSGVSRISAGPGIYVNPPLGTGLVTISADPVVGQVVQTRYTTNDSVFFTSSTSFTNVTGMSLSITPRAITSRIYVVFAFQMGGGNYGMYRLLRNGNPIGLGSSVGLGNRIQITGGVVGDQAASYGKYTTYALIDSPFSTSPVTYQLQCKAYGPAYTPVGINFSFQGDDNADYVARAASHVTLMEILST